MAPLISYTRNSVTTDKPGPKLATTRRAWEHRNAEFGELRPDFVAEEYDLKPEDIEDDRQNSHWSNDRDSKMSDREEVSNVTDGADLRQLGFSVIFPRHGAGKKRNRESIVLSTNDIMRRPSHDPIPERHARQISVNSTSSTLNVKDHHNVVFSLRGIQRGWPDLDDEATVEALRNLSGRSGKSASGRAIVRCVWRSRPSSSSHPTADGPNTHTQSKRVTSSYSGSPRRSWDRRESPSMNGIPAPGISPILSARLKNSRPLSSPPTTVFRRSSSQSIQLPAAHDSRDTGSRRSLPPSPNAHTSFLPRIRRGYWNRRGDHLTPDGQIVYAPPALAYPAELAAYPLEAEGYQNEDREFLPYADRPELSASLPWKGRVPRRPYQSFVAYVDHDPMASSSPHWSSIDPFPRGHTSPKHVTRRPSHKKSPPTATKQESKSDVESPSKSTDTTDIWDLYYKMLSTHGSKRPPSPTSSSSSYGSAHSVRSRASSFSGSAGGHIPGTTRDVLEFPFGYPTPN